MSETGRGCCACARVLQGTESVPRGWGPFTLPWPLIREVGPQAPGPGLAQRNPRKNVATQLQSPPDYTHKIKLIRQGSLHRQSTDQRQSQISHTRRPSADGLPQVSRRHRSKTLLAGCNIFPRRDTHVTQPMITESGISLWLGCFRWFGRSRICGDAVYRV